MRSPKAALNYALEHLTVSMRLLGDCLPSLLNGRLRFFCRDVGSSEGRKVKKKKSGEKLGSLAVDLSRPLVRAAHVILWILAAWPVFLSANIEFPVLPLSMDS